MSPTKLVELENLQSKFVCIQSGGRYPGFLIEWIFYWIESSQIKSFWINFLIEFSGKKSPNGDTLGPVELIVWPEQGNQGDWREQDG